MANAKRIISVKLKRIVDDSPDTSYLGEYSSRMASDWYSIDRDHSLDCIENDLWQKAKLERIADAMEMQDEDDPAIGSVRELQYCDCGECGDRKRNEYRFFFNPNVENYKGLSHAEIRQYTRQDYKRMESGQRGNWCMIGIRAEARVQLVSTLVQEITSGGLWGIESDSDRAHFEEVEAGQLAELRDELKALGFSQRAISQAFKKLERTDD